MQRPKKTKEQILTPGTSLSTEMYVSWDGNMVENVKDRIKAFANLNAAVEEFQAIQSHERSVGSYGRDTYRGLYTDVSSRPGLTRGDYESFRPSEAVPRKMKEIWATCDNIYHRVGLIRNIIDLMGDFTCQGIRVVHPNKKIEKFYQNWWHRIEGFNRSERIANNLYRKAAVVIKKQTAKILKKDQEKIQKAIASADMTITHLTVNSREIPWKYTLLDPGIVDVIGGPLASFVGQPLYGIQLPEMLKMIIRSPRNDLESEIVAQLPEEIKRAADSSAPILLNPDKLSVLHYKKDDWQAWAYPMIYAIMDDIFVLEKLKLADVAALDGAISNIRIFKIGSLQHSIAPTREAALKLAGILQSHTGVGTLDMIWGPDIELLETSTNVHQFLGSAKYEPTLGAIYAGLGIPPTLTGTFGASGTTNNFVSLQTLIQRLEYGRSVLQSFWEEEFVAVQKAMGFRFPAKLEFDHPNLGDTQSAMSLMVQLADRNLISDELLRRHFKHDPEIERIRINREHKDRESGKYVPKAGAFHEPQFELALKKVFAQTGVITPSQSGLDLDEPKVGEQPAIKMKPVSGQGGAPTTKKSGVSGQGRPKNKKDSVKRKEKKFTPRSKAVVELWAKAAQEAISEYSNPLILESFNKKNMRQLTAEEHVSAEDIKFNVLWHHEPLGEINDHTVLAALQKSLPNSVLEYRGNIISGCSKELNKKLNLDEVRAIQAAIYAENYGDDENG